MGRKLPEDAFTYYVGLGDARSYQAVADHFKASKRAVVKAASREDWASRLEKIEKRNREILDEKLGEDVAAMRLRHSKMLRAMASRAVKAIQEYPLASGMEGMKAADMVIKLERLSAGEPSVRNEVVIAQVTKQEIDRFIALNTEAKSDDGDEDDDW